MDRTYSPTKNGRFNGVEDLAQESSYSTPTQSPDISTSPEPAISSHGSGLQPTLLKRNANDAFGDDLASSRDAKKFKDEDSSNEYAPVLIAHCPHAWQRMNEKHLTWGVAYEIARLVSKGQVAPKEITAAKLDRLRGSNKVSAPQVGRIFANTGIDTGVDQATAREISASSPWEELDREEDALAIGPHEGIGNNPRLPGWYGGKVAFQGQLVDDDRKFRIILDNCALGGSCRLTRRFGSWSVLRIKVPPSLFFGNNHNLISFFLRPFIIWDRTFRFFDAKDGKCFLYCTNEVYPCGLKRRDRLSLEEFIDWHNPMSENRKQLMSKWASRMTLGLSTSIPGPRLPLENILGEYDEVSTSDSDMTDGCGLSSKSIHRFLFDNLDLHSLPTAFQFRLAGYKGMSIMYDDGTTDSEDMKIWCRPSQSKIKYGGNPDFDPAKLTLEILRTSHMRSPARLSRDITINLSENGVPSSVFTSLLSASIRTMIGGLTEWDGPDGMFKLWVNIERSGNVLSARRARESVGEARARGYTSKSPDEIDMENEEDEDELEEGITERRSTPWWPDYVSGCPSSLEETVMAMLEAGFSPKESPLLRDKLHKIVTSKIENYLQKLKFEVEQSCVAFAVPDPFCVLEPEEVQIRSSKRNLKLNDGWLTDTVLGDVLVTRNPCKIPTDVRKVKAVEHPRLRNHVDVIVFSVKGHRRLVDFLAGGDYDGDKVMAIWTEEIVSPFQNADEKHSTEPDGLDLSFTRVTETVDNFLSRTMPLVEDDRRRELQKYLLGPLDDPSLRGRYSNMHDNSMYQIGYRNPLTVELGYKFCRVMDAAKTGWRIIPATFKADLQKYNERQPRWKEFSNKKDKPKASTLDTTNFSNMPYLERDMNSLFITGKMFIMDVLVEAAKQEKVALLSEMTTLFSSPPVEPDPVLIAPWDELVQWSERGDPDVVKMKRRDLGLIAIHVQQQFIVHSAALSSKGNQNFTARRIEDRQDRLRKASKTFASGPPIEDLPTIADKVLLARVRASYAYKYDAEQKAAGEGWSRFPFNVAMRDLCDIKARSSGNGIHKVLQNAFYERFKMVT